MAFHGGDDISVVVDEAGAQVTWDDKQKLYLVKNLHATMGETFAVLAGQATPPAARFANLERRAWRRKQAAVGPGKPGETAIPLKSTMQIHVTPATGQVIVDNMARFHADGDGLALA